MAFESMGVDKYEISITLDNRTSSICRNLENKIFKMKDYKLGVTAPPFHPNCRSVAIPYFDDEIQKEIEQDRVVRDSRGKSIKVKDMSYKEWEKWVSSPYEDIAYKYKKMSIIRPGEVRELKEVTLDGVKYAVDGHNIIIDHNRIERETAKWVSENLGGYVYLSPRITCVEKQTSPDFKWLNEFWELKTISSHSKNTVTTQIANALKQSENIILNLTLDSYTDDIITKELDRIFYNNKHKKLKKLMILKNDKLVGLYIRK